MGQRLTQLFTFLFLFSSAGLLVGGVAVITTDLGPDATGQNTPTIESNTPATPGETGTPDPVRNQTEETTTTPPSTGTPAPESEQSNTGVSLNESRIERLVHEGINEEREKKNLSTLSWDPALQDIAYYHSQQMATKDFFAHESPEGERFDDRYERFGYECEVPKTDTEYLIGGENIAQTYHHTEVTGYGRLTTEQEVANGLVDQWMTSPPHRENLLNPVWRAEGIGIHITDEKEVYATQNFC